MINKILRPFGIKMARLGEADAMIDSSLEFIELYEKIKPFTMTSRERCFALYTATKYILARNIPGDFVECGVWRGGNTMLIAYLLQRHGVTNRKIYLYDTFEGMSEPTEHDRKTNQTESALKKWRSTQKENYTDWCYSSIEEVTENMSQTAYPADKLIFVKGKVEDTLQKTLPGNISLLRLDTDWYESTKAELDVLYPLLQPNGILIIDDYGAWEGARKAVDEYFKNNPILLNKIDDTGLIGVKTV
jgi:hypothetical protein